MRLEEAYEMRRKEVLALKRQVEKLQKELTQVSEGLFPPAEKASLLKQINQLSHKLRAAEKERDRYHDMWEREHKRNMYHDFEKLDLAEENARLKKELEKLRNRPEPVRQKTDAEAAAKIRALSNEVARLRSILDNDGTNSGTPTGKTPLNKDKVIPNSRGKSGRKKGGQKGHVKHTLSADTGVTEEEIHSLDACPRCGGALEETGCDDKDELDYEVRVIRKRHRFLKYRCPVCGREFRAPVPGHLKEKCQYGSALKAMVLSLLNIGFVSVNRVKKLLRGLFDGRLEPCEAFIIGMQKKAAAKLEAFAADVKQKLKKEKILYWDDTVVFISTSRSCMRFYGTELLALFTAHEKKDRAGIDEDGVLKALGSGTYVMHDHVTLNYNADFSFINIECCQHLQRDLQKLSDMSGHQWAGQLKKLISSTIHDRTQRKAQGKTFFPGEYIQGFNTRLDGLLAMGDREYEADHGHYYEEDERRLLSRLRQYRENYFMWVTDFRLPTTNNLSERALRFTKVHEKVSGQFESLKYARYFALIRTYLETCARNGINEYKALLRLTRNDPYSLKEVLSFSGS